MSWFWWGGAIESVDSEPTLALALADSATVPTDAYVQVEGQLKTVADNVSLTDALAITVEHRVSLTDDVNLLADGEARVTGVITSLADTLEALADIEAHWLAYLLSLTDSTAANWADAHQLLLAQFLALSDLYALSDALEHQIGTTLTLADDTGTLTDDVQLLLVHQLTLTDVNQSFPSIPVLDDFNRTDEGPPPSANWTAGIGILGSELFTAPQVSGNQLVRIGGDPERECYWNVTQFGPDSECYITAVEAAGLARIYLCVRLTDIGEGTTNGYYIRVISGSSLRIVRVDAGAGTIIATGPTHTILSGNKYGIQIISDRIALLIDTGGGWEELLSATDSTYSTAGFIGLYTNSTSASALDDFGGGTATGGLVDFFAHQLVIVDDGSRSVDLSDSLALLSDSLTLGYGLDIAEDVASLTDTITLNIDQRLQLTDDIAVLADAATLQLTYLLDLDDFFVVVDGETHTLGYDHLLTDTIILTDDESARLGQLLSFDESIDNLVDAYTQLADGLLSFTDSFALSDSIQLGYGLLLTDDIDFLLDDIITSAPQGPLRQVGVTDLIDNLADSAALQLGYLLAVDDVITLTDSVTVAQGLLIAFDDSLSLDDTATLTLGHSVPLADMFTLSDSVQLQLGHELALTDVASLGDAVALNLSLDLALGDNAALLADSVVKSVDLGLILTDNAPLLTEAIELFSAGSLQFAETLTLTDSLAKSSAGFLSLDDLLLFTDDIALELRGPDLDVSLSDSFALTDAIALGLGNELRLQLAVSDVITLADHYFDLRHPYTPSAKRHVVVPSRARLTTPTVRQGVVVPSSSRTTKVP